MQPHEKRGMLIGATLDITLGQFMDKVNEIDLDTVPSHLDERIGTIINCLQTMSAVEDADAGQVYTQQLALMTTEDLHYIVRTFGKDPFAGTDPERRPGDGSAGPNNLGR